MGRASNAKGARGERFFLPHLQALFGHEIPKPDGTTESSVQIRQAGATADLGDFTGVPWLHEAKNSVPHFLKWAREADDKLDNGRWVILWKNDLRKREGPYVLMPLSFYVELVSSSPNQPTNMEDNHEA